MFNYKNIDSVPASFYENLIVTDKKTGSPAIPKVKKAECVIPYAKGELKVKTDVNRGLASIYPFALASSPSDEFRFYDAVSVAECGKEEYGGTSLDFDDNSGTYIDGPYGYVPDNSVKLTFEQMKHRMLVFIKLCHLCSNEEFLKKLGSIAPKKKNGTFAKNRITRIATMDAISCYSECYELVGFPKSDTELLLKVRRSNFTYKNYDNMMSDMISTDEDLFNL